MNVRTLPVDAATRARLLLRLDGTLLENVVHMLELIDRTATPETKKAVLKWCGALVALTEELPSHSAETRRGQEIREAIRQNCVEIERIVAASHAGGGPTPD